MKTTTKQLLQLLRSTAKGLRIRLVALETFVREYKDAQELEEPVTNTSICFSVMLDSGIIPGINRTVFISVMLRDNYSFLDAHPGYIVVKNDITEFILKNVTDLAYCNTPIKRRQSEIIGILTTVYSKLCTMLRTQGKIRVESFSFTVDGIERILSVERP